MKLSARLFFVLVVATTLSLAPARSANNWISRINDIVPGAASTVWFSLPDRGSVAFLEPGGCFYTVNVAHDRGLPTRLLSAHDGTLWFVLPASQQIGFITEHRIHYLSVRSLHETPGQLVEDKRDGALWLIPSFGSRLVRIQDGAITNIVSVSEADALIQGGAFLPDGRLVLAIGSELEYVNLARGRILSVIHLSAPPSKIAVLGSSVWLLEPMLNRLLVVGSNGGVRSITLPPQAPPAPAAALLVSPEAVFVGTAGGVYIMSQDGGGLHRVAVNRAGVVSVLSLVDGSPWYGSYDGDVGYIQNDVSHEVDLRERTLASALSCGSIIPSDWLR